MPHDDILKRVEVARGQLLQTKSFSTLGQELQLPARTIRSPTGFSKYVKVIGDEEKEETATKASGKKQTHENANEDLLDQLKLQVGMLSPVTHQTMHRSLQIVIPSRPN